MLYSKCVVTCNTDERRIEEFDVALTLIVKVQIVKHFLIEMRHCHPKCNAFLINSQHPK